MSPQTTSNHVPDRRNDFERANDTRAEAEQSGIVSPRNHSGPAYVLDLNMGTITVNKGLEMLAALVRIARKNAPSEANGEHVAILSLKVREDEIDSDRPYFFRAVGSMPGVISLRELLEQNAISVADLCQG